MGELYKKIKCLIWNKKTSFNMLIIHYYKKCSMYITWVEILLNVFILLDTCNKNGHGLAPVVPVSVNGGQCKGF